MNHISSKQPIHKSIILVILMFLVNLVTFAQEAEIQKIKSYFEQKKYDTCIQSCNVLIKDYPSLTKAFYYRALSFYNKSDYKKAINDFNVVIDNEPALTESYAYRGACKNIMKLDDEACVDWHEGLSRGDVQCKQLYQQYCSNQKNFNITYQKEILKAKAFIANKKYNEAIKALDVADTISPNHSNTFLMNAIIQQQMNNNEMAISYLEKAIQADSANIKAYNTRADILVNQKEYLLALNDLTQSLALNPNQNELYLTTAICKNKLKMPKDALKDVTLYLQENPKNLQAMSVRAVALETIDPKKSLIEYQRILTVAPLDSSALYGKANLLFEIGQIDQACSDWQKAYYLGIKDAEHKFNTYCVQSTEVAKNLLAKGQEKIQQHQLEIAKLFITKSIAMDAGNSKAYLYRARVQYGLKKYELALRDYNAYLKLNFSDETAFYHRALTYKALNRYDLACQDLKEARSLGLKVDQREIDECCK